MKQKRNELSVAVGALLAHQRRELHMTQAQLADKLRVQRTSISQIESGRQVLLLDLYYELCRLLSLSPVATLDSAIATMNSEKSAFHSRIEDIVAESTSAEGEEG